MSRKKPFQIEGPMFVAYLWLYLLAPVAAQDSGGAPQTDDQFVGWQAGNNKRGTWNIITSCLSTIIACTWSIQHLNVPGEEDSKWNRWLRSVKWMVITILFPELIVIHAIFEFSMAWQALQVMESKGKSVELPWWRFPRRKHQRAADAESQPAQNDRRWTLTHCFFANMGGFYYEQEDSQIPLTALQLAQEPGFERPKFKEEQIADKSKSDGFAKVVATLQFLQLALSLIVRTNRGLAFSQLETVTLTFAVCGVVIYLVYLYKPQNVETPLRERPPSAQEAPPMQGTPQNESASGNLQSKSTYDSFWNILINESGQTNTKTSGPRIPNDNVPISESRVAHPVVLPLALASGLFGAMHAIAWHFEFPSSIERILWQTATVVAAGSPVVGLITIPLAQKTVSAGDSQLFMGNCLRLMTEYAWEISEKDAVDAAHQKLESILTGRKEHELYANIFTLALAQQLLKFLEGTDDQTTQRLDLQKDEGFKRHFQLLINVLQNAAPKKLIESATTKAFPQKSLLPPACNQGILYATTLLYGLSRLSLLAVSFSSLRQMPESVYVTTPWTGYIPTLGSSK